ncbi:hypothetical protein ACNKHW_16825 [Shigella flexneri]
MLPMCRAKVFLLIQWKSTITEETFQTLLVSRALEDWAVPSSEQTQAK